MLKKFFILIKETIRSEIKKYFKDKEDRKKESDKRISNCKKIANALHNVQWPRK
jgi:hypothetical protein